MTAPYSDQPDPATGFDPNRHRKEIELMEQRFRERSERHGGGPVTTGEIDGRVADEMREFFDASEQQLKTVVPRLQSPDQNRAMAETTDEIRKKINDFFAQVKDGGSGGRDKSPPTQRLAKRKARWTGTLPGRVDAQSAPGAFPTAFEPPESSSRRDAPAAPRASARTPATDSEKMDLRTALEKLRRHGVVKGDERSAPAQVVAPPDVTPARAAPPRRESNFVASPRYEPAPPAAPPRREPPPPVAAPAPTRREAPPPPAPRPAAPVVADRRPPRAAPRPAPEAAPAQSDPGDGFDSIFKEVEGIVLDTLKAKPDEAPAPAARAAKPAEPPTLREQEPISEPVSQLVCLNTDSDEVEQAPPPREPASSRAPQFARPEEDAEEEPDEAPAAPYDWGVKPAARPSGAWLLDVPEEPPVAQEEPPAADEAKPAAPPPEADSSNSMRGARNFLVRKAGDEVRRFQPVLKALKDAAVLDAKDIDGRSNAAADGEDGFLSADSFNDDVPRGADVEAELSPMRLVEELRRIKRVTKALMDKGVISARDLEKTDGD
jgi:hypothetical protein